PSTSAITTRAPSAAKPSVIARPRLDAPPVTMTTRPSSPRSIAAEFWRKRKWRAAEPPSRNLLLRRLVRSVAVERPHERGRQALRLRLAGVGARPVDVDRYLRFRQLRLHVGGAVRLLQIDAHRLRVLLLLERRLFLVGDLAARQDADELLRERDVLDVDAA